MAGEARIEQAALYPYHGMQIFLQVERQFFRSQQTGISMNCEDTSSTRFARCRWTRSIATRDFVAGVTVYFPVFVPGALLHVGEGHATQGDGEIVGT